jgi:poly(A) polymerase
MRESARRKFLTRPNFADHLELHRVNCLSRKRSLETYEFCLQKLQEYDREPAVTPLLSGEDLIAMGYTPGPIFKEILQSVEDLQLEGALRTREEAIAHIKSGFPPAGKTNQGA